MRLRILRGVSGSGKSTWAELQALAGKTVVVSRDRIRMSLFGREFGEGVDEDLVTAVQDATIKSSLRGGFDVIVDDTNINWRYVKRFAKIGQSIPGVEVTVQTFRVDVEEAIKNNAHRASNGGRNVPEDVIRKQAQRIKGTYENKLDPAPVYREYEPDPTKPKAVMVDIDGTLANMVNRGPYDESKVLDDELVEAVAATVQVFVDAGYLILMCSGRTEASREHTMQWLDRHGVECWDLFMRQTGDVRADNIVKYELFDENIRDEYNVLLVLDDRQQVVDMWRAIGLTCLQVAPGDF